MLSCSAGSYYVPNGWELSIIQKSGAIAGQFSLLGFPVKVTMSIPILPTRVNTKFNVSDQFFSFYVIKDFSFFLCVKLLFVITKLYGHLNIKQGMRAIDRMANSF